MPGKQKKSALDVDYLRTAPSFSLASSVLATSVQEKEQQLLHEKQSQQIAIDHLLNNPYQPRLAMEEESLQQLSETIASHGFQGMLVARPAPQRPGYYQITAGHRRREAARRAGIQTLPVLVHDWSDQEMATLSATENIQREDLSPLEEGRLFQLMIDEMGLTQVEVAQSIKKDRGYVRNRLRLAKAPEDIQAFVTTKTDSMRAVIYLLDIEDPAERAPLIEQLLKKTLTTEDLPAYIEEMKRRKAQPQLPPPTATEPPPIPSTPEVQPPAMTAPLTPPAPQIAQQPQTTPREREIPTLEQAIATTMLTQNAAATVAPEATKPAPRPDTLTMSEERVRQTRLKTILRYLKDYQHLLTGKNGMSEDERVLLQEIGEYVQELMG